MKQPSFISNNFFLIFWCVPIWLVDPTFQCDGWKQQNTRNCANHNGMSGFFPGPKCPKVNNSTEMVSLTLMSNMLITESLFYWGWCNPLWNYRAVKYWRETVLSIIHIEVFCNTLYFLYLIAIVKLLRLEDHMHIMSRI